MNEMLIFVKIISFQKKFIWWFSRPQVSSLDVNFQFRKEEKWHEFDLIDMENAALVHSYPSSKTTDQIMSRLQIRNWQSRLDFVKTFYYTEWSRIISRVWNINKKNNIDTIKKLFSLQERTIFVILIVFITVLNMMSFKCLSSLTIHSLP